MIHSDKQTQQTKHEDTPYSFAKHWILLPPIIGTKSDDNMYMLIIGDLRYIGLIFQHQNQIGNICKNLADKDIHIVKKTCLW